MTALLRIPLLPLSNNVVRSDDLSTAVPSISSETPLAWDRPSEDCSNSSERWPMPRFNQKPLDSVALQKDVANLSQDRTQERQLSSLIKLAPTCSTSMDKCPIMDHMDKRAAAQMMDNTPVIVASENKTLSDSSASKFKPFTSTKAPLIELEIPESISTELTSSSSSSSPSIQDSPPNLATADSQLCNNSPVIPELHLPVPPIRTRVEEFSDWVTLENLVSVNPTSKLYWGRLEGTAVVVKVVSKCFQLECQQLQREFEALCILDAHLSEPMDDHSIHHHHYQSIHSIYANTPYQHRADDLPKLLSDAPNDRRINYPSGAIAKPFALLETLQELAFVSERLDGPDLCQYLTRHKKGRLTEPEARVVMERLLTVVNAIHQIGYVHRDIKLPNLVLRDAEDLGSLALVDFGFSCRLDDQVEMLRCCGSPGTCAPEILMGYSGDDGGRVDAFSVGVVLCTLLTGTPPFLAECPLVILRLNCRAKFLFDGAIWSTISTGAKDLVRSLTRRLPEDRLSISNALIHPWISSF